EQGTGAVKITPRRDVSPVDSIPLHGNNVALVVDIFSPVRLMRPAKLCDNNVFGGGDARIATQEFFDPPPAKTLFDVRIFTHSMIVLQGLEAVQALEQYLVHPSLVGL